MAKLKPYDPILDGEAVNEENCFALTGCTPEELYAFTGVYAHIPPEEISGADIRGRYPSPNILLLADNVEIEITLHIEDRYIFDELFVCQVAGQNIGLKMFCRQLEESVKETLESIKLEAARETFEDKPLIGYIVWAKYGFLMDAMSVPVFEEIVQPYCNRFTPPVAVPSLQELLTTHEGVEFWETHGETWFGTFDLKENSASWAILNAYKKKKGL